jgi:DNA repair photolyase
MPPRPLSNPPNPWVSVSLEWLGPPPTSTTKVYVERARTLVVANDSPDVPFRFGANAYRGCAHACAYCYARPTHEFLGFGAGTDFESQLVVKENAPELLQRELRRGVTGGEPLVFSGITDPYQPLEASFELTRRLLEVCLQAQQPVTILTKGALVRRDVDLLAKLAHGPGARVYITLISLDETLARALEPGAPTPALRLRALAELSAAGISTGVSLSPLILGLNESEGPALLEAAHAAGARRAFRTLLRLPGSVEAVFFERLQSELPGRVERIRRAQLEARGGRLQDGRFFNRMVGTGARYEAAEQLLALRARQLGMLLGEGAGLVLPGAAPSAATGTAAPASPSDPRLPTRSADQSEPRPSAVKTPPDPTPGPARQGRLFEF